MHSARASAVDPKMPFLGGGGPALSGYRCPSSGGERGETTPGPHILFSEVDESHLVLLSCRGLEAGEGCTLAHDRWLQDHNGVSHSALPELPLCPFLLPGMLQAPTLVCDTHRGKEERQILRWILAGA